ncbi:MAG: co-chaperone DjlA [Thiohalobacteraceae bacterium]|nr:co-chaperone DjlA [Gammaproteobacteria bacterium]
MGWWGTALGGAFGFLLGGPLGALLGAALGRRFDKGIDRIGLLGADPGDQERVQTAFFTATFAVMGHLAKVDGQITKDEIRLAESVMARMQLGADMRRTAIRLFDEGKAPDFDLDAVLDQFRRECRGRRHLLQMFIEIQLHACYADGAIHAEEDRVLRHICDRLGFSAREFAHLEALVRAARTFTGAGAGAGAGSWGARPGAPPSRDRLADAYQVLGVGRAATDAEIKTAYRRLMNQHHPDKLVAKGLPEEMIALATEKTQEIKAAYETVKAARGTR